LILCVNCGNEMEDDATECPVCGTQVRDIESEDEKQAVTQDNDEEALAENEAEETLEGEEAAGEEPEEPEEEQEEEEIEEAPAEDEAGETLEGGEAAAEDPEKAEEEREEQEPENAPSDVEAEGEEEATGTKEAAKEMTVEAGGFDVPKTADASSAHAEGQKGKVLGALICGLLGIVFFWVPVAGLVLSVVAIFLGSKVRAKQSAWKRGLAITGFVLGVIGLVIGIGALIWWIVVLTSGAKVFWLLGSLA